MSTDNPLAGYRVRVRVVPTAGLEWQKIVTPLGITFEPEIFPTEIGQARLRAAFEAMRASPRQADLIEELTIAGGRAVYNRPSEGEFYHGWAEKYLQNPYGVWIGPLGCGEGCTVRDMVRLAEDLKRRRSDLIRETTIILHCHPDQGALAVPVLRSFGFQDVTVDNRHDEPAPYSPPIFWLLKLVTALDPLWERPISAPLRWFARWRDARQYRMPRHLAHPAGS